MSDIIYHDTLCDRREFWRLLDDQRMSDALRFRFVNQCLALSNYRLKFQLATLRDGSYPVAAAHSDILMISNKLGVDLTIILLRLVDFVRSIHK